MARDVVKDLNLGWIPIFHEISLKLLKYKNDRKPLIEMLYSTFDEPIGEGNPFTDMKAKPKNKSKEEIKRNAIRLDDICPFTLFAAVNRQDNRNTEVLKNFCEFLDLSINDFCFSPYVERAHDAVPIANNMSVWLFPYKYDRKLDDIDKLWKLFEISILYANDASIREEFINAYNDCIKIAKTGNYKLSQALYTVRPRSYPMFKTGSINYLQNFISNENHIMQILVKQNRNEKYTGEEYLKVRDGLNQELSGRHGKGNVFVMLAHHSYVKTEDHSGKQLSNSLDVTSKKNKVVLPLNQILYGPPGTGKTYETAKLAVEVITGEQQSDSADARSEIINKYQMLRDAGRIEFVTFHQSYGYEEFVEGIRPKLKGDNNSGLKYEIKPGIFRRICEKAQRPLDNEPYSKKEISDKAGITNINDYTGRKVWWLTLKNHWRLLGNCFDNNHVLFAAKLDPFKDIGNLEDSVGYEKMKSIKRTPNRMSIFYEEMKEGDIFVMSTKEGGKRICAAGVLGQYKYKEDNEIFKHTRDVKEWLWYSLENSIDISDISPEPKLTKNMIIARTDINSNELINKLPLDNHLDEHREITANAHTLPSNNYVLIIDEINRGNISKILGELITLLEDDKRLGNKEALEVMLPYSGNTFGVPNNLYIIGTMNTADRSIAFLDTALRRRFQFTEMMPRYTNSKGVSLFNSVTSSGVKNGIDIAEMLRSMNKSIVQKLGIDYQIGHSYFIGNKVKTIDQLANTFRNSICPLLEEYFYDRRERIPNILNNSKLIRGHNENWEWADADAFRDKDNYISIYSGIDQ